ncbi:MAG: hypothetical protein GXO92_06195 [FCB group bacterium]|nr:hypothetical protein [FCB group bacterium]
MEFLPGLQATLNLHPMFVHFPIVITLLALLSEIVHKVFKKAVYGEMAGVLLNLAALSAVVALITGYWASDSLGHDTPGHDYVHGHRDVMLWFTALLVLAATVFQFIKKLRKGIYRLVTLVILSGLLMLGADLGARLVYTYGVGVNKTIETHEDDDDHDSAIENNIDGDEHFDED